MWKLAIYILEQELRQLKKDQQARARKQKVPSRLLDMNQRIMLVTQQVQSLKKQMKVIIRYDEDEKHADRIMKEIGRNMKATGTYGK